MTKQDFKRRLEELTLLLYLHPGTTKEEKRHLVIINAQAQKNLALAKLNLTLFVVSLYLNVLIMIYETYYGTTPICDYKKRKV